MFLPWGGSGWWWMLKVALPCHGDGLTDLRPPLADDLFPSQRRRTLAILRLV